MFKCESDNKSYALKIIKNKKAYAVQAAVEIKIIDYLNNIVDPNDNYHFIRIHEHFIYKYHTCMVFELLDENLYDLLKKNYFKGLSLNTVRYIIKPILEGINQLHKHNIIHCDLKPENVLLKADNDIKFKITDFGSACWKNATTFSYIQSRYYRSPEVLLGAPYSTEIDIWSVGCVAAELYLGIPLFAGSNEYDQLSKIINFVDTFDLKIFYSKANKKIRKFFNNNGILKTKEEYYNEYKTEEKPLYGYPYDIKNFDDILSLKQDNRINTNLNHNEKEIFIHFLQGLLTIDFKNRMTAKNALNHPFISKTNFEGILINYLFRIFDSSERRG